MWCEALISGSVVIVTIVAIVTITKIYADWMKS